MICPACQLANAPDAEDCFGCGMALFALTQGRVLAERYEIRRPLGQGGMGRVYEAFDRTLEVLVAIKVLRPQFAREPEMARRFLLEIRLARRITHPNVCRLHEYGESGGIRYLCMELVDGVNLKEVLRARRLATDRAYEIALAAAEGLEAVHAQGVIHRDFKTANIMVDGRGQVKVMDFGIAKEVGSDTTGVSLAGHVLGTPEYMSPEHAQGGPVDFRSDLYALGCVIFEVFAGRALFRGTSPIDTLRRHLHQPVDFRSARGLLVPEALVPVLTRALAKKPEDRYASVTALAEELRSARSASALHAVLGDDEPLADLLEATPTPTPVSMTPAPEPVPPGPTRALTAGERPGDPRPVPAAPRVRGWLVGVVGAAALVAIVALAWSRGAAPLPGDLAPPAMASAPPPTVITPAPALPSPSPEPPASTLAPVLRPARSDDRPRMPTSTSVRPSPPPKTLVERAAVIADAPAPTLPPPITTPSSTLSEEFGVISLLIVPASEVTIDGNTLGIVSSRVVRLAAGAHAVTVEHPGYLPYKRKVDVSAGTATEFILDLSEKGVPKKP